MGQIEESSKAAKMRAVAVLGPLVVCLVTSAPYNEVQPSQPSPARLDSGSVQCRTEYTTVWDTQYQERESQECVTDYEKVCHTKTERLCKATTRKECRTVYEKSCRTAYKSVCVEKYKTEYEPYTETECTTEYKDDCEYQWEGQGYDKVWAPIPGTCKQNPYDSCKDVTKTKERQVSYPVCNDVPEEICQDVPTQQCRQVPDNVCTNQPIKQCEDVPREHCTTKHKKVPIRVSKNVPKKVCDTGYGYSANVSPVANPEVVIDVERTTNLRSNKIVFAN